MGWILVSYLLLTFSNGFISYLHHSPLPSCSKKSTLNTISLQVTLPTQSDHDILVRAYKGEKVERIPVWLMRQAGRYMKDFRKFSEKYPFRQRSETPDIAIELSLQPWKRFGLDGVIMFSDILTPLPAMGIDFTIIENKGPKIINPIRTSNDVDLLKTLTNIEDEVPFLGPIIKSLRKETEGKTSLIGFIGAPWTLAAYSVEGGHSKLSAKIKTLMIENPELTHKLLRIYTDNLCKYASYQVECGAQIIQIFESWAHHLSEDQFITFAKPYASTIANYLKARHPDTPVVYFANGGSCFLHQQLDMPMDALSIDWRISMKHAREIAGPNCVLAGNIDPIVLYGSEKNIRTAVRDCIEASEGKKHILNLGHGVEKDTTEESVEILVNAAREMSQLSLPLV